jgi:hypothetical protein
MMVALILIIGVRVMPFSVAKQIIRYRCWFVAMANAAIAWIVLIIAPLGLFAVITCTAAIFASSLSLGMLGDFALFSLLKPSGWRPMESEAEAEAMQAWNEPMSDSPSRSVSRESERPNLPDR